jgi:competence protein ComEA
VDPDRAPAWRILESDPPSAVDPPRQPAPLTVVGAAIALISVVLVIVAALIVVLASGGPTDPSVGPAGLTMQAAAGVELVVEVAGAVTRPGIYRLPDGSRLADAIAAAGGYSPRVDTLAAARELNLAGLLSDGDRIVIPSRDAAVTGGQSGDAAAGGTATKPVALNSATQAELEALPGIGPATATKIIAAREERPFRSVDELLVRKVVGRATFAKIRDLVSAGG